MQNLSLLAAWLILAGVLMTLGDAALWFEPLSLGVVLGAPLALSCARRGPGRTAQDLALAWGAGAVDTTLSEAPPAMLAPAAANLRALGNDALVVGVLFAFANVIALLRSFAVDLGDPAEQLVGELGALVFAPAAGLVFKVLLTDVLAGRVERVIFRAYDDAGVDPRVNPH